MKNVSAYIVQVTLVRSNTAMTWFLLPTCDYRRLEADRGLLILIIFVLSINELHNYPSPSNCEKNK